MAITDFNITQTALTSLCRDPWQVASPTGHHIQGWTDRCDGAAPRNQAIIQVHGLTGSMDEHLHQVAAGYFAGHGYDVLRFNLQSQDFPLRQATIKTHGEDVQAVIAAQAARYDKLFVIGHSYGGPTVMTALPREAAAICLWDPSFDLPMIWQKMTVIEQEGLAWLNFGGVEVAVGQAMVAEGRSRDYSAENCLALSRDLNRPIKVISASQGDEYEVFQKSGLSWHSAGHPANCRVLIPGSDHCFTTPEALASLLVETHEWFAQYG
ncbi:MAG: alpha/beta fold hydrolase [Pseudomonadota bacterium]